MMNDDLSSAGGLIGAISDFETPCPVNGLCFLSL